MRRGGREVGAAVEPADGQPVLHLVLAADARSYLLNPRQPRRRRWERPQEDALKDGVLAAANLQHSDDPGV